MNKVVLSASTSWYPYNFRFNTIKRLVSMGYDVYVVCPKDDPIGDFSDRYNSLGAKFVNIKMERGGVNLIKDLRTIFDYYKVYKEIKPNYIFNFTPKVNIYSTLVGRIFTKNIVNNMSGLGAGFNSSKILFVISFLMYFSSQRLASKVFFQNKADRDYFISKKIVDANKVDLLPGSGVDLNRFTFHVRNYDGPIKFLFSGRFLKSKGVLDYIKAAKIIHSKYPGKVVFSLVGFVDTKAKNYVSYQEIKGWVSEGIIEYLGSTDDIVPVLNQHHCIVLPSFYAEGVPKSLLEAGATGMALITSNNVGCRDAVDDSLNGFIHEKDNLVEVLEKYISLPIEEKLRMSEASRRKMVCEYDEDIGINKYTDTLN